MRLTDVVVVGGGLAGSVAAAMLGDVGIATVLIDPHETYPADFRCEKLDSSQLALLAQTGLAARILPVLTFGREVWVARFGRLLRRRRHEQAGFSYQTLVEAFRAQIPASVPRIRGKAAAIRTGEERQEVTLSSGEIVSARLVVLATGLNNAIRQSLGIRREILSQTHSVTIGFDLVPRGGRDFAFTSLTYSPEKHSDKTSYLTLFPIGDRMRANLFVYRDINDSWLRDVQLAPEASLKALMPRLQSMIGDFAVTGDLRVRPVDLYTTDGVAQPGVVLVGDAFGTSCPAAGTGVNKVLTDVVQLCTLHLPGWLATPGMGVAKIAAFYADPVKVENDRRSREKAFFLRDLSTESSLTWRVQRLVRGAAQLVFGAVETLRHGHPASDVVDDDAGDEPQTLGPTGMAR